MINQIFKAVGKHIQERRKDPRVFGSRPLEYAALLTPLAVIFGSMYLHIQPPKSQTPEEILTEMGYDPDLVTNMPDGVDLELATKQNLFNRIFFENAVVCESAVLKRKYNETRFGALQEEECDIDIITTPDGRQFEFFATSEEKKLNRLRALFHEWAHHENTNWPVSDWAIEIDSDLEARRAMDMLGIDATEFHETTVERRAVYAFLFLFTNGLNDDYHNSALASALYPNVTSPEELEIIAQQTKYAADKLFWDLLTDLEKGKTRTESLEEFKTILETAMIERKWAQPYRNETPENIRNIDTLAELLHDGVQTLLENEITPPTPDALPAGP